MADRGRGEGATVSTLRIRARRSRLLANDWQTLTRESYEFLTRDGTWVAHRRELYDRGNAATVLPYDLATGALYLCRQFRLPAFVNGHPDGMLLETPGGSIDADEDPKTAAAREIEEELGLRMGPLTPVFQTYMSAGSVSEKLYAFAGQVEAKVSVGGGIAEEGEEIEPVILSFGEAFAMALAGEIDDAKTYSLLMWAAHGPFREQADRVRR